MQKAKGKVKGLRMIHEIRRLSSLGITQRKIAKALDISRNIVKKYHNQSNAELGEKKPHSAPWSGQLDWDKVKNECERGESLYNY